MKELFPEEYGLVGCELAAAAMVKYYINEVDVQMDLKKIMGDSVVDGDGLAALIDRAVEYCVERAQRSDAAELMCKVRGRRVVQEISVGMLEYLMDLCKNL